MRVLSDSMQSIFLRASLSDVCNFNCRYCPKDLGMENHTPKDINAPVLEAHEYIRNMELLAVHGFRNISFTGGEPLLNKDFALIASACRRLFDIIEITTNGTNILSNIDIIMQNIDVLKISIDAMDPDVAVHISGNKASAGTPGIIEACCQAGIRTIGLNFVYMRYNSAQLPKLIKYAARMKEKYGTDIYISILDLYYSEQNKCFWQRQFVNLSEVRAALTAQGIRLNHRIRIGCDSYYYEQDGIRINMKDSISCTHRADMCYNCTEYCQEGIYSLKHSASGWISVCPTNNPNYGSLLNGTIHDEEAERYIDYYVDVLNNIKRIRDTGKEFAEKRKALS